MTTSTYSGLAFSYGRGMFAAGFVAGFATGLLIALAVSATAAELSITSVKQTIYFDGQSNRCIGVTFPQVRPSVSSVLFKENMTNAWRYVVSYQTTENGGAWVVNTRLVSTNSDGAYVHNSMTDSLSTAAITTNGMTELQDFYLPENGFYMVRITTR